jgi:HPt (histidine-containing phosphotransfer) domain-containing protein
MVLEDLPNYIDINIAKGLEERFMGSEALYVRFLHKLADSQEFVQLQAAVQAADWQEALRLAHNLKGVCATLEMGTLSGNFAAIVTLLRRDSFAAQDVQQSLQCVRDEWDKTLACIKRLQESA